MTAQSMLAANVLVGLWNNDELRAIQSQQAAIAQQQFRLWAYANPEAYEQYRADQAALADQQRWELACAPYRAAIRKFREAKEFRRKFPFLGRWVDRVSGPPYLTISVFWGAIQHGVITWAEAKAEGMIPGGVTTPDPVYAPGAKDAGQATYRRPQRPVHPALGPAPHKVYELPSGVVVTDKRSTR